MLVIGAGPAGCAIACALADRGRAVQVWERRPGPPRRKVGETLPAAARPLLRDLGLAQLWDTPAHVPSPGARVLWESDEVRLVDALRDPQGASLHLDRGRFEADLWAALAARGVRPAVRRFLSVRREDSRDPGRPWRPGERWVVEDAAGQVRPRFLVDASGRSCVVARALAVRRRFDRPLLAIVEWRRRVPGDRDQRLLIEATPAGWWYSAPLRGTDGPERVFVFHTDPQDASRLRRDAAAWSRALAETRLLAPWTGGGSLGAPAACGAGGAVLAPPGGPGWLAVGDAALSFEPLASQGLFHALYCGLRGGQAVDAALAGDAEPGIAYGLILADVRRQYLAHQRAFHGAMRRFPESAFWERRGGAGGG